MLADTLIQVQSHSLNENSLSINAQTVAIPSDSCSEAIVGRLTTPKERRKREEEPKETHRKAAAQLSKGVVFSIFAGKDVSPIYQYQYNQKGR